MPRALWSGAISFGLVSVPVKAYPATRDHKVHFKEMTAQGGQVRHERVSASTGKAVEDVRLGFETSKGHFVRFKPGEIDDLRPASTRTIDITDFVELSEIDPIFYAKTYWLGAATDEAKHPYALLRTAMEDEQRVGIGAVVMRRTQYLAAIRPIEGALAMSTMRFADEVVPSSEIPGVPTRATKATPKEKALARKIVEAFAAKWEPERYHDTYTEELRTLIAKRAKGETIAVEEETPEPKGEVVDLMAALQASVDKARGTRGGRRKTKRSA
jgi:DNA end-binding protein Ku